MDAASGRDLVRAELARTQRDARTTIHRGVALIAAMPVVLVAAVLGGFPEFLSVLVASTYMLVGGIAGVGCIVAGVAEHRRSTRHLRELDAVRQLPAARIVVR